MKIKIGEYGVMNCDHFYFKKGEKVRVVEYWGIKNLDKGYRVESLDKEHLLNVYEHRVDAIEEKLLLPIGAKVKLVKPVFGSEHIPINSIGVVEKANENRVVIRYEKFYFFSVNAQCLREEWEVVEEWSEWKHDSNREIFYRVKGKEIQAKDGINKVTTKCMECDTFDLNKGLDICLAKLDLKDAQQRLEKLTK